MAQLGVYGAITKIAVVMTLFTQMYRLAAEPFFLANFSREEFKESAAAAMKYFVMVSMAIFLGITLFRDLFALIVGRDFREGVDILPIILAGNILSGVWLNLSFWYKREEKTRYAVYVTFAGLGVSIVACLTLIPLTGGYAGAAWARLAAEAAMVGVSYLLMRRYYPVQYDVRRIAEYVVAGVALYLVAEVFAKQCQPTAVVQYGVNAVMMVAYFAYAVWREKIDLRAMVRAILKRRV